ISDGISEQPGAAPIGLVLAAPAVERELAQVARQVEDLDGWAAREIGNAHPIALAAPRRLRTLQLRRVAALGVEADGLRSEPAPAPHRVLAGRGVAAPGEAALFAAA